MTTEEQKKLAEVDFDRMREVIQSTWLPIMRGADTVGETRLSTGDVFRIATALINAGFHLERKATWEHCLSTPGGIHDRYKCTSCGFTTGWTTDFCGGCGAKMLED